MALIATTTTAMVTINEKREEEMVSPPIGKVTSWTPCQASSPAAKTWPDSLVIQSRSQTSSAAPSRQTRAAAASTAHGSWAPPPKTGRRNGICQATPRATTTPNSMATPPRRGVGRVCMSRSRTGVMAPTLMASRRTAGTATKVTRAETSPSRT